jgi:hypothetical protein
VIRVAKVSIRVQSGAARFDVAIVADSEEQAIVLFRERYRAGDVRVKSLIGLEGRSVDGRAARTREDGSSHTDTLAA